MTVIGDLRVFRTLEPAVGPTGHISGGAHFYRTLPPFLVGYTEPGDGSYAEALRRAHEEADVPSSLIGESISWNASIMVQMAARSGHGNLVADLEDAARGIAEDANCDPTLIVAARSVLDDTFGGVLVIPEMIGAFWDVVGYSRIREMTGNLPDADILGICWQSLPAGFVEQFRR
jgi:hypothetical protein